MAQSSAALSQLWGEPGDRGHMPHLHAQAHNASAAGLPLQFNVEPPLSAGQSRHVPLFQFNKQPQAMQHHQDGAATNFHYRTFDPSLGPSSFVGHGISGLTKSEQHSGGSNVVDWVFEHAQKPPSINAAVPIPTSSLDGFSGAPASSQAGIATTVPVSVPSAPSRHPSGISANIGPNTAPFVPASTLAGVAPYTLPPSASGAPIAVSQPAHTIPSGASSSIASSINLASDTSRGSIDVNADTGSVGAPHLGHGLPEVTTSKPPYQASSSSPSSSHGRLGSSPESNSRSIKYTAGDVLINNAASAMANVDSWMAASLDFTPSGMGPVGAPDIPASSTRASGGLQYPSSSQAPQSRLRQSQSSSSQPQFKTSAERRERNKASQRESRKRRQDRLEMLEAENAALRKALASVKNDKAGRGASSKFSGAIFLDVIEPHLEDNSDEQGFNDLIGHRFPEQKSEAQEVFNELDVYDPRDTEGVDPGQSSDTAISHSAYGEAAEIPEEETIQVDKSSGPVRNGRGPNPKRKNVWELGISHHESSKSFTSLVVVPELVLYKVCRLYFSLVLPFTTSLQSGICNLRAARAAPFLLGGPDELPRFRGDPSDESRPELVLPQNLMPTENQLRIGFHPVEIAVIPFPSMRDKLLTILEAFHSLRGLEDVPEGARITEDERAYSPASTHPDIHVGKMQQRTAIISDMSTWTPHDEPDPKNAVVIPDRNRRYEYGFTNKPKGSPKMGRPAQRFLDEFFVEVVRSLRIWTPAGDVFDPEGFELRESFFEKYPALVDEKILRATNRWRRARGQAPIRL